MTPLGSFTIGASLPVIDNSQILVVLRDTKKGKDTLYRINAGRKLRIVVDGRTAIEVNSDGVVLIDVTEGEIQSIEITNKNQVSNQATATTNKNVPSSSVLTNPHLSGSPKDWIPGSDEIPSIMQRMDDIERTNEYVAKESADPTQTTDLFKKWGRITGYMQWYYTKEGCNAKAGLVEVVMAPSLYMTDTGAKQSLGFNKSLDKTNIRVDTTSTVGEEAYIGYSTEELIGCDPPFEARAVGIMFRRYNATGYVVVWGVPGTVTDDYMLSIAT